MNEIEALNEELLRGLDREIEAAAVEGDAERFLRLKMREAALPRLIREARMRPVLEEIERLEGELAALDEEARRAREEPPPEVPVRLRGMQTSTMLQSARLGNISDRTRATGKELKSLRRRLLEIEGAGPREPY